MAVLLQLETASKNCSVAISTKGETIAMVEASSDQFIHSEKLHLFIEEVLNKAQLTFKNLDGIAVSKGPGSYTGLRIGVSSAKGFCYALSIPLIAIDSLRVLASPLFNVAEGLIVPLMDARRMEVYTATYSSTGKELEGVSAKILDQNSFAELLEKGLVHFVGDGVEKLQDILEHPNARFYSAPFPSAKDMSTLSFEKFKNKNFEDVAYFEPFYLKDFVAGAPKKLL